MRSRPRPLTLASFTNLLSTGTPMADPAEKHTTSVKLINISSPHHEPSSSESSDSGSRSSSPASPTPPEKPSQDQITKMRKKATQIETSLKRISKSIKKRKKLPACLYLCGNTDSFDNNPAREPDHSHNRRSPCKFKCLKVDFMSILS